MMNMHERIMSGRLFTDMCEGLPEERLLAKQYMKRFNDSAPDAVSERASLMEKMLGSCKGAWI